MFALKVTVRKQRAVDIVDKKVIVYVFNCVHWGNEIRVPMPKIGNGIQRCLLVIVGTNLVGGTV